MSTQIFQSPDQAADDRSEVSALYRSVLDSWNRRDARDFAALFGDESHIVGFDGSLMDRRAEIESSLQEIFADHETARYVGKVREVRLLAPGVAILRAVAGMISPGQTDLNPAVNTIQSLVAVKQAGNWRIVHYQNTPAQFHGRPDLAQQLTEELRQLI